MLLNNFGQSNKTRKSYREEYVYWNNIDELKDRLKFLEAEEAAGNDNVHNEIISIKEELLEEKKNIKPKKNKILICIREVTNN